MSSEQEHEQEQVRTLLGWLLFAALGALAVIGAFLAINASDDDDDGSGSGTEATADPGDSGASDDGGAAGDGSAAGNGSGDDAEMMAPPDVDAIQAAARSAGVVDAVASYNGEEVLLGGSAPDLDTRVAAVRAARSAAGDTVVRPTITLPPAVADMGPADIEAELIAQGLSPDEFEIRDGVVYIFARASAVEGLGEEFGVQTVFVTPDERRRAALAVLRDNGVLSPNASLSSTSPLTVRLEGEVPDEATRDAIVAEVEAIPFIDAVVDELRLPAEPVVTFTVENGVVTLTGTVADDETRLAVLEQAGVLFGAGNVVDELQVGPVAEGALRLEGQVPAVQRDAIQAGLTELASTLGLEFDDQFTYAELTDEQAALQGELDELLGAIQINFASGSSTLPADAAGQLDTLVEALGAAPHGTIIAVEGHTDDQGDAGSNQTLSEARAQSVVDYLVGAGVDEALLRAVGNGESQPIADNETAEGRAANRRIEFNVVV